MLHADMVGYSAITAESEQRALRCVTAINETFQAAIPAHGGEFQASGGDSFLAIFPSAADAVAAAVEIQTRLGTAPEWFGEPLRLRIGIHLGEVTWASIGLLGDCINIAARIQAEARPGGIAISDVVYRDVRSRIPITVTDAGTKTLKNVGPIRLYHVVLPHLADGLGERRWVGRRRLMAAATVVGLGGVTYVLLAGRERARPTQPSEAALAIAVMEIVPRGDTPEWMCDVTHQGLNALLSKFEQLKVFSKDMIDWKKEKTGQRSFDVAKELGVTKMINGTLVQAHGRVVLQVRIVDTDSGRQVDSCEAGGSDDQLVAIQNDVGMKIVHALKVAVTRAQIDEALATRTNVDLDVTRRFAEAFGGEEPPPPADAPGAWRFTWPAEAFGAESSDEAEVTRLLERYRGALEAKSVDELAAVYVVVTDQTRDALRQYFDAAKGLTVQFSNVTIVFEGEEGLVTFTRADRFEDVRTGQLVNLEVRASAVVARQNGAWRIKMLRRPS